MPRVEFFQIIECERPKMIEGRVLGARQGGLSEVLAPRLTCFHLCCAPCRIEQAWELDLGRLGSSLAGLSLLSRDMDVTRLNVPCQLGVQWTNEYYQGEKVRPSRTACLSSSRTACLSPLSLSRPPSLPPFVHYIIRLCVQQATSLRVGSSNVNHRRAQRFVRTMCVGLLFSSMSPVHNTYLLHRHMSLDPSHQHQDTVHARQALLSSSLSGSKCTCVSKAHICTLRVFYVHPSR